MIPIVTPAEMAAIDAAAPEPVDVLIDRAGAAVARAARRMLGGTYGRVVNVIAGKGNNGTDGRVAGALLAARGRHGARVRRGDVPAVAAARRPRRSTPPTAPGSTATGRRRDVGDAPVLAVDIPSGVDGLTGDAVAGALAGGRTVTFAALKPGLLLGAGKRLAGDGRGRRHRPRRVVGARPRRRAPPTSPAGGGPARPTPTSGRGRCGSSPAARA